MIRMTLAALVLVASAEGARAQTTTPATQFDYAAFVEANRPQASQRKLNGAERGQMNKAISTWKASRSEADLVAIRPFAEAGEADALKTMFEGYGLLRTNSGKRVASSALLEPEFALKPLRAVGYRLWTCCRPKRANRQSDVRMPQRRP